MGISSEQRLSRPGLFHPALPLRPMADLALHHEQTSEKTALCERKNNNYSTSNLMIMPIIIVIILIIIIILIIAAI